ncbi:MAG: hypothetical protein EAX86_06425 [Candidatus Heimdallarchaeota archaeon]|nr:hypothetical protein [Candidatus Heimdallarchaeota archaeon]
MNTESKKPRLIFLDNMKLFFAILVIFQHARVTYEGSGWWYYVESNLVDPFSYIIFALLTSIGGLFQSSLLGLFFLLGGYFTPRSYDNKGVKLFWKERLTRLGIPFLLYSVLIDPLLKYYLATLGIEPWNSQPVLTGSLIDYYLVQFRSLESFVNFLTSAGPMWFLFVLLIFTAGYTFWRHLDSVQQYIPKEFSIPRYGYLLFLGIILGIATFMVRIEFAIDEFPLGVPLPFMIQYLMMFTVGALAARYNWFEIMFRETKYFKAWSITIVVSFLAFFVYIFLVLGIDSNLNVFMGGISVPALIFAVVDNVICLSMIFVLIPIFHKKFNTQNLLLQRFSSTSFHMYLIHPPILIFLSLLFAPISLFPVIKLAVVFPITIFLCYSASYYGLQKIL